MVALSALWLPILLAAVIVFIASSIIHMVLPYHRSNYRRLPDEDKLRATLRSVNLASGLYNFPFCTPKEMSTPEAKAKYVEGPVGYMIILPNGPVVLPKFLGLWFAYCLVVGLFVAYLSAHTVAHGAPYPHVFRVVGSAAFLAYGIGTLSNAIWKSFPWKMVLLETFDGLIYALLTAGTFGWLWPR
jgi:hypothetical protein